MFAEAARDVQKLKGIESEIALEADDGQGMEDLVEGVGAGSEADLERMDEDKEEADKEEGGEEGEQEGEEEDGEDDE